MNNNLKEYSFLYCSFFAAGAFVGAAANIAGSAISGAISSQLQRDAMEFESGEARINRDFQRDERLQSQEWNEMMWNKNNVYNSYSSQLKRAEEAGISPNAIFGNGAGTIASNPVTTSPMSGSKANFPGFGDMSWTKGISNIGVDTINSLNMLTQKKELESLITLNDQQIAWNNDTYDDRVKEVSSRVNNIVESTNNLISSTNVNNKSADKIVADTAVVNATLPYICDKQQVDIDVALATADEIRTRTRELKLNGKYDRANKNAHTALLQAEESLVGSQAKVQEKNEDEQIANAEYESNMLKLKNDFCNAWGMPLETPEFAFMWSLNENGLLSQYLEKVQGAYARVTSYNESQGRKSSDAFENVHKILLDLLLMGLSKGRVNPKMLR